MFKGKTAEQWEAMATASRRREADSFERCDTDGALTQWCAGKSAQEFRLCAELARRNGQWEFPALFDLEGNLLDAVNIKTRFGWAWRVKINGAVVWFNPSEARKGSTRLANDTRKGFKLGTVRCDAYVKGSGDLVTLSYFCVPVPDAVVTVVDDGSQGTQYSEDY